MRKKYRETDITTNLEEYDRRQAAPDDPSVPYLVVLAGESIGRVVRLMKNETMVIGRSRSSDIYMDCSNISRAHARFEVDGNGATTVVDMGSTNGTIVNGKKITSQVVSDGDRICLGNVILRYSQKDGLEYDFQQTLYDKATKDPLTGVFNKRYFMETLNKEYAFHQRQNQPLSIIMIDLDDFKRVNDTYGHVHGDIVLKEFARKIGGSLRTEDLLARFGGEEFVILFRKTELDVALDIANKLWGLSNELKFETSERQFQVTATYGVATLINNNFTSADALLMGADQNLYIGKNSGKNRVVG